MGTAKKTRKFGAVSESHLGVLYPRYILISYLQVKRIIGQNDARLKKNQEKGEEGAKKADKGSEVVREVYVRSSRLFFTISCVYFIPAALYTDHQQPASFFCALLPVQYSPCTTI